MKIRIFDQDRMKELIKKVNSFLKEEHQWGDHQKVIESINDDLSEKDYAYDTINEFEFELIYYHTKSGHTERVDVSEFLTETEK